MTLEERVNDLECRLLNVIDLLKYTVTLSTGLTKNDTKHILEQLERLQ